MRPKQCLLAIHGLPTPYVLVVGGQEHMLRYLSRYTHRVAISNHRLVSFADQRVTFRWLDCAHNNEQKLLTLSINEFLRRFLLHLLPDSFVRIRRWTHGGRPETHGRRSTASFSTPGHCRRMKQLFPSRKLCVFWHGPLLFALSPNKSLFPASTCIGSASAANPRGSLQVALPGSAPQHLTPVTYFAKRASVKALRLIGT